MQTSGVISSAEMDAPHPLQVISQAFRTPNQTEPLKGVLASNVKMTVVGWINDGLNALEGETPEKVVALFKEILAPVGTVISGGSSHIEQEDEHTWAMEVVIYRSVNDKTSNCLIEAVITLADQWISNIKIEIEPYQC